MSREFPSPRSRGGGCSSTPPGVSRSGDRRPTRALPRKIIVDKPTAGTRRTGGAPSAAGSPRRSTGQPRTWPVRGQEHRRRRARRPRATPLAYAIGTAHPVSLLLDTFGTEQVDPEKLRAACGTSSISAPPVTAPFVARPDLSGDGSLRPLGPEGIPLGRGTAPRRRSPRRGRLSPPSSPDRSRSASDRAAAAVSIVRSPTTFRPSSRPASILVQVPFHGRAVRGWVLGPTDDVPRRVLAVKKAVSPTRWFDEDGLALCRWVSERYVAPLAAVLERATPPRVAAEEVGRRSASPDPVAREVWPPWGPRGLPEARTSWTRSRPARRGRGCSGRRPSTRAPSWSRLSLDASTPDGERS